MAVYRSVSLNFWQDSKIVDDFTWKERYFYLYLLTNPHTNIIGCYEISYKQMADETGLEVEDVKILIERFENTHKVLTYNPRTKEVLIKKWAKYNWTRSEKLLKSVENVIPYVKSETLKEKMNEILNEYRKQIGYGYRIDTSVTDTVTDNINKKIKNSFKENEKLINLFEEYLQFRKSHKLSNSKTVVNDLLEFLDDYDDKEKEKIIKKAIKNGWKDLYPLDDRKDKKREVVNYETV